MPLSKTFVRRTVQIALGVSIVLLVIILNPLNAHAAYEPGRLIDDNVFLDSRSMSIDDVQNFLASKNSGLKNMNFTLQCYGSGSQERQWYTSAGARCDTPIPASHVIYYAAQVYGVNPKVILATMQKEQSLTTAPNPTVWQLTQAMGYACPTSGSCNTSSSFPYQIDSGTWALRYHFERARGNMTWWSTSSSWTCGTEKNLYKPSLYPRQNVRFYDTNGTHYTTVYIQNPATSSFYCYTPHAYNNPQGLYGRAPYGSTGLYYSGSYNFVLFYEQWFGSPSTPPSMTCDSKVTNTICVWSVKKSDGSQFLTTSETELKATMYTYGWFNEGIGFYASRTAKSGALPVYRMRLDNRHYYTADQAEYATLKNTAGWADEGIIFYVLPKTTSANISHQVYKLRNTSNNQYYWVKDQTQKNYLLNDGYVVDGHVFNSSSGAADLPTPPSGRVNIYRLRENAGYFYTTSLHELETVVKMGYRYEGVLTTTNTTNTGTAVYRLQYGNNHFYTTDASERDVAVSRYGHRYEGVGFYLDSSSAQVYRLANSVGGGYLYTSNINEVMLSANINGWSYEGALINRANELVPVYRFLNLQNDRHFYTINLNEAIGITNKGWRYETIAFHANQSTGLPVFRMRIHDKHFYTANASEKDIAVSRYGYQYEGVAFYASPGATDRPAYRLQGGNDEYFYTASSSERDSAVNRYGYRYEGLGFYLPSN